MFLSNSTEGVSIVYKPNVSTKRSVFVTPDLALKHKGFAKTLKNVMDSLGSKWKMVNTFDELFDYHERDVARPIKQRRPMDMIMLCLNAEKASPEFQGVKWAFTIDGFMEFLSRPACSTSAVSGL